MFWCFWTEDTYACLCLPLLRQVLYFPRTIRAAIYSRTGAGEAGLAPSWWPRPPSRQPPRFPRPRLHQCAHSGAHGGGRAARSRHAARPHRPSHYHRETHSLLKHFAQFPQIWEMCVYTHHWLMALRMRDCLAHCNLEFAVVFSVLKPFRPALKQNIFLIIEYNISAFEIQPIITD